MNAVGAQLVADNRLSRIKTTHLLTVPAPGADSARSEKESKAAQWGIPIVTIDWLEDCAISGKVAPVPKQCVTAAASSSRSKQCEESRPKEPITRLLAEGESGRKQLSTEESDLDELLGWDVTGSKCRQTTGSGRSHAGGAEGSRAGGGSPPGSQGAFVVEPAFEVDTRA